MRIGLALPQYDYSITGESPLSWESLADAARRAEGLGFDSLWLSDHLFLDLAKYGASSRVYGAYEPLVTLAALAGTVRTARLGTLVLCEALRPASVLAKALATLDLITDGRLDVGMGAGWYEPEYEAVGLAFPPPRVRLERLAEALDVCRAMLGAGGEPVTVPGRFHRADGARLLPHPRQEPRPRVFVGGKGDRLLRVAAEHADGWNTCWVWTPEAYRDRLAVLDRACEAIGRDPATVWRTLGLYALCGDDDADLDRRFGRLRAATPTGVLDTTSLAQWRTGRLVGTTDEVAEQVEGWAERGVETLVLGVGAVPFQVGDWSDVEALAACVLGAREHTDAARA